MNSTDSDSETHWTDAHIRLRGEQEWVAYDEAGLEYDTYPTKSAAREALVWYSINILGQDEG